MEEGREARILEETVKKAVLTTFGRYFNVHELEPLVQRFDQGLTVEASEAKPSAEYVKGIRGAGELAQALVKLGTQENPPAVASAVEFILEGLHLNRRLNRDKVEGTYRYRG